MYRNRHFSRGGGGTGGAGSGGGLGSGAGSMGDMPRRRRIRGHFARRRPTSGTGGGIYRGGSFSDDRNDSSPPPQNRQVSTGDESNYANPSQQPQQQLYYKQSRARPHHSRGGMRNYEQRNQDRTYHDGSFPHRQSQQTAPKQFDQSDSEFTERTYNEATQFNPSIGSGPGAGKDQAPAKKVEEIYKSFQSQKSDLNDLRTLFTKMHLELDQVKTRLKELESSQVCQDTSVNQHRQQSTKNPIGSGKLSGQTDKDARRKAKLLRQRERKAAKQAEKRATATVASNRSAPTTTEAVTQTQDKPQKILNAENATTSSEKALDIDSKDRVRVFKRRRPYFSRRGTYVGRRRRTSSPDHNSADTSPQNEPTEGANDDQARYKKRSNVVRGKSYPELSEAEVTEIVEALKFDFLNTDRPANTIRKNLDAKGPKVTYEFAVAILDHAICDVTSPTKLSEISQNLYQLIVGEEGNRGIDFQKGFYEALTGISKREDDIAIDAPRYLDTLGQILAECVAPMYFKHKGFVRKFLNKCVDSYGDKNRAILVACIMKSIAGLKGDRFARKIWDLSELQWNKILNDDNIVESFVESQEVQFTTRELSPEPQKPKRSAEQLEKFADDVTDLVERQCSAETLDDLIKELDLGPNDIKDHYGTFIYAIVRGCLISDSEGYRLNHEALNKYKCLLDANYPDKEAIALYALTALTRLWHLYNCPQDLMKNILLTLHSNGTASYRVLQEWLNLETLNHTPGIGAARLNCKRTVDDLGASLKAQKE